jgi:hypothetical protein
MMDLHFSVTVRSATLEYESAPELIDWLRKAIHMVLRNTLRADRLIQHSEIFCTDAELTSSFYF